MNPSEFIREVFSSVNVADGTLFEIDHFITATAILVDTCNRFLSPDATVEEAAALCAVYLPLVERKMLMLGLSDAD